MSKYTPMQAVRMVNRLMKSYDQSSEIARECDAGFDGGEFSGSFHDDQDEQTLLNVITLVCSKTGVSPRQLESEMVEDQRRWIMSTISF